MADTKTKTTSKKTTKKETEKRESAKSEALARDRKRRQINSVVLFAAGVLLLAFAVLAFEATAWAAVRGFLHRLFGAAMYAVGPALIFMAIRRRVILTVSVGLLLCALLHIVGDFGGGTGFAVSYPLMFFGRVGAGIIVVLITFVLVMLMGNISLDSFLKFTGKPFKKVGEYAKEQRELHKQDAEYLEEARKQCQTEEAYTKMKAAERSIEKEIGKEVESEAKFASIMSALPPSYIAPDENEENGEYRDYGSDEEHEDNAVSGENDDDLPPFDVPGEDNAVLTAIDCYQQEEAEEEQEKQQREELLTKSPPLNELDNALAITDFGEQYSLPALNLLDNSVKKRSESDLQAEQDANAEKLIETLKSFGVMTRLVGVIRGPSVTRYEIQPLPGVKIAKITALQDDIALNLAAAGVRMEAPIPGKSAVGVEVPNAVRDTVTFRELIDSKDFRETASNLGAVIGKDITGEIIISDIAKMPHLLIAGTTGSGKSVCVNTIIMSILYRATPNDVRLIMIDPKMVEFAIYSGIPHLLTPVVTDPKKAAGALGWAVGEMTQRYALFAENNVRNIAEYNDLVNKGRVGDSDTSEEALRMPKIVIFIDELADLMMTAAREVEGNICRIAQLARAAGIHLVIATQRPTTNVVTGLIKANIPSRIGLKVASQVDSRVIFDTAGAEKLLGNGDMLYAPTGIPKPVRVQGCWVSNDEINRVVSFIKDNFELEYDENVIEEIERQALAVGEKDKPGDSDEEFDMSDDKLEDAIEAVIDAGKASTSYLQLKLKLGYGRAARIIDIMEKMGVVGKFEGSKPREVLMTRQDWLERKMHIDG
jgi:S-DNA-T family DNA segregation ATPase FtsK/SpoIIIE